MNTEDLLKLAVAVTVIIGALVAIGRISVWLWRVLQKLARLTDDLVGEPGRPGMTEGRPGVLDRLVLIEQGQQAMQHQLEVIASWEHRLARLEAMQQAPDATADQGNGHTPA